MHTNLALTLEQFQTLSKEGASIIDTRNPPEVKQGYIPDSISIPVHTSGSYTSWIEGVLPKQKSLILVAEPGNEQDTISKFTTIGYDQVKGYLEGGFETWTKAGNPVEKYDSIPAKDVAGKISENPNIVDVRDPGDWQKGVLEGAKLIDLPHLISRINEVPKDQPVYVHCNSGGRSLSAYSVLRSLGYKNAVDIAGGIKGVAAAGAELKTPKSN